MFYFGVEYVGCVYIYRVNFNLLIGVLGYVNSYKEIFIGL